MSWTYLESLQTMLGRKSKERSLQLHSDSMWGSNTPQKESRFVPEIVISDHFWNHLLDRFFNVFWIASDTILGTLLGTGSAQQKPRWTRASQQEPQRTENLQVRKPKKAIGFSRFLECQVVQESLRNLKKPSKRLLNPSRNSKKKGSRKGAAK